MTLMMIGILIGLFIGNFIIRSSSDGVMMIDDTDPDKVLYKLELNTLDGLSSQRLIVLKVRNKKI